MTGELTKPLHEKPEIGKPPAYITAGGTLPSTFASVELSRLRHVLMQGEKGVKNQRKDFIETCLKYVDDLRVRKRPEVEEFGMKIVEDCGKLKDARNLLVDWVLLESEYSPIGEFSDALSDLLEQLLSAKLPPDELGAWNDSWFEAHSLFVYETFLYIIAALLKAEALKVLGSVFSSHYLVQHRGTFHYHTFERFYGASQRLQGVLGPVRYQSPAAELIKRQSDRKDLPFASIMEAELLIFLMATISDTAEWYPQTYHYASHGVAYPFFIRTTQHKGFLKLAEITGLSQPSKLKEAVTRGMERLKVEQWESFHFVLTFRHAMNLDKMDSIR